MKLTEREKKIKEYCEKRLKKLDVAIQTEGMDEREAFLMGNQKGIKEILNILDKESEKTCQNCEIKESNLELKPCYKCIRNVVLVKDFWKPKKDVFENEDYKFEVIDEGIDISWLEDGETVKSGMFFKGKDIELLEKAIKRSKELR